MMFCFQHKKKIEDCGCHRGTIEYRRAGHLVARRSAMEVFYATQAFSENIAYKPEAMMQMAHSYLTVADVLTDFLLGPNPTPEETVAWLVKAKKMLQEAGFVLRVETQNPQTD